MNKFLIDDHVLPRPVERLPDYAHGRARQSLAEKLQDSFGLSSKSATAIANAVVDPTEVRRSIGEPADPDVEKIPVPGGTLLGIRTHVWARRIMPDPRNPRTLPSRRHPFAIGPGTGGEDSKFRPVPEPRALDPDAPHKAELAVTIESRDHLAWAARQAADYVLAENDWRLSIASHGVMEAVWLAATTYQHADGSSAVTTLTTAEGSSRCTGVHNILEIRSADVPYDENEAALRTRIRKLNEAYDRGADKKEAIPLRCERVPALILVGFRPHPYGTTGFSTAVKSLVALRHVDPPKPWGDGPENESLADEVLDELYRQDLITATERDYFAGSCTRAEARTAHMPDDPVLRASKIVHLFTNRNERVEEAIRVAVTSQSTRKRITPKLLNDLATALILRAVADDRAKIDQVRRYLRHAFGKSVHHAAWESTGRSTEHLVKEALAEVKRAITTGSTEEPGPASLELAARGAYPLIVSGRLNADRGSTGEQPDRRTPGEVLEEMRRSIQGVHQLGQALRDYAADIPIRAVDEAGHIKTPDDNSGELTINDVYLRTEFPPPGKRPVRSGDTAGDRYDNALNTFSASLDGVEQAFSQLNQVVGHDGRPLVEAKGVDPRSVANWRDLLTRINEELLVWGRTYSRVYGANNGPAVHPDAESADLDPYADHEEAEDGWDSADNSTRVDEIAAE